MKILKFLNDLLYSWNYFDYVVIMIINRNEAELMICVYKEALEKSFVVFVLVIVRNVDLAVENGTLEVCQAQYLDVQNWFLLDCLNI